MHQRKIYWKQRARVKWLREGDNNTKFFHAFASNRKRRNFIQSIKNNGEWVYEFHTIKKLFIDHFKNIYSSNLCNKFSFDNLAEQTLSTNEWSDLNQYPTQHEI